MGTFNWLFKTKKIIEKYVEQGDVISLKNYLNENDLNNNQMIRAFFINNFNMEIPDFFRLFNVDGKFNEEINIYENYYYPEFIKLVLKTNPYIIDNLPQQYIDFIKYCNNLKLKDANQINKYLNVFMLNHDITELFNNGLTKKYFDLLLKDVSLFDIGLLIKKNSVINDGFTDYEKRLIRLINKHSFVFINNFYDQRIAFEQLIKTVDRSDYHKYITILRNMGKDYLKINWENDLIKKSLFNQKLKNNYKYQSYRMVNDQLYQLDSVEKSYYEKNDQILDDYFIQNNIDSKSIHKIFTILDNALIATEMFVNSLIDNRDYEILFYVLKKYCSKEIFEQYQINSDIPKSTIIKLVEIYKTMIKTKDVEPLKLFILALKENKELITMDKEKFNHAIDITQKLCQKITNSNSKEFENFGSNILSHILKNSETLNYINAINKIDYVFSNGDLPDFIKRYVIFDVLNPDMAEFDFSSSYISPSLAAVNLETRKKIIYNDLLRCATNSNNLIIKRFLEKINIGNEIYQKIMQKKIDFENIDGQLKKSILNHEKTLTFLYEYAIKDKKELAFTNDVLNNITLLNNFFTNNGQNTIIDGIVSIYCKFLGITSFSELLNYMDYSMEKTNEENYRRSKERFILKKGDLIKGIGSSEYFYEILQNGVLCKEFLGPNISRDKTPLDTDLSLVMEERKTLDKTINTTSAFYYGPIYIVLKRNNNHILDNRIYKSEYLEKPEIFRTLAYDHIGIRTGFPSNEIAYIVINYNDELLEDLSLKIALNGMYIPIVDKKSGECIFPYEKYELLRLKMGGLQYYGLNSYYISNNLEVSRHYDINKTSEKSLVKKTYIEKTIERYIKDKYNQDVNYYLDNNVANGSVDIIDIGSTSRKTNIDDTADLDYIIRVDKGISISDFVRGLAYAFGNPEKTKAIINHNKLLLSKVKIPSLNAECNIDITVTSKTNEVIYSSDMAVMEKLNWIYENRNDLYELVIDNIIFAKEYFKENDIYKKKSQLHSGFSGICIENWILQNGGSFYDAAASFVHAATENGELIPFERFNKKYKIYNFGISFYNGMHNEFIKESADSDTYKKIYYALVDYLSLYKKQNSDKVRTRSV